MRIALIDDDFTTNFINKNKLKKQVENCEVFTFGNGKETIDFLLEGNKLDVALLDMNMPIMNGLEFLKKHSELEKEQKITRIFLFVEQNVVEDFKEKYDLFQVLKKPLTKEIIELITSDK
ncbi:MAG: response regulator [Flavobacteriales bacterium]